MTEGHLYQEALKRLIDMVPEPKPIRIRQSATVVPWRLDETGRVEVFWVQRSTALGVLGGWHAFPGGGVGRGDDSILVAHAPQVNLDFRTSFPVFDSEPPASVDLSDDVVVCAVRELFEETGILLADVGLDKLPQLEALRQVLLSGKEDFAKVLSVLGATVDARRLSFAGRWLTPPVAPVRFDTRFFLLHWPESEAVQPVVDGGELTGGEWIAAEDAVRRWERYEILAAPPTLFVLEVLGTDGVERGLSRLVQHGDEPNRPIRRFLESRPGIIGLPLITPTLPPARETISYLVGRDEVVLVDVGSPFPSEIDRLAGILEFMRVELGKRLVAIWLTHHHPDHVWGVEPIRQRFDVPVLAHPDAVERIRSLGVTVDGVLVDGQRVRLGGDPPFEVEIVSTPGHAKGHISIFDATHGSLIAGDLVTGMGTVLIDPPDGDMDEYLASLERVRSLRPRTLFPAHGPAILDPATRIELLIAHRMERERKIEDCWIKGNREAPAIVLEAYSDVSETLYPFAERQVLAHLTRLRRLGRIGS